MTEHYKTLIETIHIKTEGFDNNLKVKRGKLSFEWFLVVYGIILSIFLSVISIINDLNFWIKLLIILIGSIILFWFCMFNSWFRNKVVVIFSQAKDKYEKP